MPAVIAMENKKKVRRRDAIKITVGTLSMLFDPHSCSKKNNLIIQENKKEGSTGWQLTLGTARLAKRIKNPLIRR